jgi:hypothetical protein
MDQPVVRERYLLLARKQKIIAMISKRQKNFKYLKLMHEGDHYWLNTVFMSKSFISSYIDRQIPAKRSYEYLCLGLGLAKVLKLEKGIHSIQGCMQLFDEWEYFISGSGMQSMKFVMAKSIACPYPELINPSSIDPSATNPSLLSLLPSRSQNQATESEPLPVPVPEIKKEEAKDEAKDACACVSAGAVKEVEIDSSPLLISDPDPAFDPSTPTDKCDEVKEDTATPSLTDTGSVIAATTEAIESRSSSSSSSTNLSIAYSSDSINISNRGRTSSSSDGLKGKRNLELKTSINKFGGEIVYQYMETPYVPFELNYHEVFKSLCALFEELYERFGHPDAYSTQMMFDSVVKLDSRIKTHAIQLISTEFTDSAIEEVSLGIEHLRCAGSVATFDD